MTVPAYDVVWTNEGSTLGFAKISFLGKRNIMFSEYVFNGAWYNPGSWLSDNLPELVAGPGTSYTITGGWVDHLRGSFSIFCAGY